MSYSNPSNGPFKVVLQTAPIALDDTSDLYAELLMLVTAAIENVAYSRTLDSIVSSSKFYAELTKLLSDRIGINIEVMVIYMHYNIEYLEKTVMVGIEVNQKVIDSFNGPSFEDMFEDYKR